MTDFGLTPAGFVRKGYADVLADMVTRQRSTIDPALDTSADAVIGQLNGIIASALAEQWEVQQALYDALDPDAVTGAQQDALYSLTNTARKVATKSKVMATVNLQPGALVGAGDAVASVDGNPSARFVNTEAMSNTGGAPADFDVVFEAEVVGPVVANAGTLTVIETFASGWNSITNADDAELGSATESDAAYRIRRVLELAAIGGGTVAGIRGDLLALTGVVAAIVIENDTDDELDGLPPHSFEAVVQGGADADIAASLLNNKPAGILAVGSDSADAVDSEGVTHTLAFSRPTGVPIYVALEVETGEGYDAAALKAAIAAAALDPLAAGYQTIGGHVYAGRIVATAMTVAGVLNARAGVSLTVISDPDDGAASLSLGARELATIDTSDIAVVVV